MSFEGKKFEKGKRKRGECKGKREMGSKSKKGR
jgi:hypothetical protein